MNGKIDISKLDKAAVLAALYNNAEPLGLGVLLWTPEDMSVEEAQKLLDEHEPYGSYFDYVHGRCLKIDLSKDVLDTWLYDRDWGDGAVLRVLSDLMKEPA